MYLFPFPSNPTLPLHHPNCIAIIQNGQLHFSLSHNFHLEKEPDTQDKDEESLNLNPVECKLSRALIKAKAVDEVARVVFPIVFLSHL